MICQRELLEDIFFAGVKAVSPDEALLRHVTLTADGKELLLANGAAYGLEKGRVFVVGGGKGVAPMARAIEKLLGDRIERGFVVAKYGHELPLRHIDTGSASHPVPDESGEAAASKILDLASQLKKGDLLICLLTGGASALLPSPAAGLTLEDLKAATAALLASGAEIREMNAIRKHLSGIAGGQLARAANGANVCSIIVSDVIGDDLAAIASGPTAPDPTTFADCLDIVEKYGLEKELPAKVMERLKAGQGGRIPETPKADSAVFEHVSNIIVASNSQAVAACAARARELGLKPVIMPEPLAGEARVAATALVEEAKRLQTALKKGDAGICLLAGGETTVTIKGTGLGGRNQEMALAAALELAGTDGICALFGGTDGNDGPTDAAGGVAFGDSLERMGGLRAAREWLENNDSNKALRTSGDLLVTGPTLTNVMDLAVLVITRARTASSASASQPVAQRVF